MDTILAHKIGNPRNSEGSFIKLKDNTLVFAYSCYTGESWHDHCSADICLIKSSDNGLSWSNPTVVVKNKAQNVMSVSLLRLKDNRIALVYLEKSLVFDGTRVDCRPYIIFSSDEMNSWTTPVDIAGVPPLYLVANNDRIIQLSNGRLLMPATYHRYKKNPNEFGRGIGLFFYSDDNGVTWEQSRECCYPPQWSVTGLQEPGVIELNPNHLMAWFRSGDGYQYKSYSYDNGNSWSEVIPAIEFKCPASPLSMKRNPYTNDLYAVWNDYTPNNSVKFVPGIMGRTPLVLGKSSDNGVTWKHYVLEDSPRHGFAYTAIYFNEDDLLLAYCCGGIDTCECMLQDLKIKIIKWRELDKE
jgi:hypothetical protein